MIYEAEHSVIFDCIQLLKIDKVTVVTNTSHVIAKTIGLMTGADFTNMDHL